MLEANAEFSKLVLFLFHVNLAPLEIALTLNPLTGRGASDMFSEFSYAPRSGLEPLETPVMSFVGALKLSSAQFDTPAPIIGLAFAKL